MISKKEKATFIEETLNLLYPNPEIPLKHKDSFTLLVAVILSAQCTDARVNEVTKHLFARACTPQEMLDLTIDEIEKIIRPCGLSKTKAKALWNLARILIEKYGGDVPSDMDKLEELPGVGHKTASVMMIQAFNTPAFPVDTHIHRCAKRWGLTDGKNVKETEEDLKKLFPSQIWHKLHLQIIYYGREFCPARGHKVEDCPLCSAIAPQ